MCKPDSEHFRRGRVHPILAAPKVLGSIRRHLSKGTLKRLSEGIPKDVSWFTERELEGYLQDKGIGD